MKWTKEAEKRLDQVPAGFMRNMSRSNIEKAAAAKGLTEVTVDFAEESLKIAKEMMGRMMGGMPEEAMREIERAGEIEEVEEEDGDKDAPLPWDSDAEKKLERVPEGFMREMTKARIEHMAKSKGLGRVTASVVDEKFGGWSEGSAKVEKTMRWSAEAEEKVQRIPEMVRGMVVKEIEALAKKKKAFGVTEELLGEAMAEWQKKGEFHSE